jgi:phage N-6-adenine-methyltransferase
MAFDHEPAQKPRSRRCSRCRSPIRPASRGRPPRNCSAACKQAAFRKRARQPVHFSSRSCEWATPPELFAALAAEFGPFDLDVCATAEDAKCARYFTQAEDGLRQRWSGRVWMNPPYGRAIGQGMHKALEVARSGEADVVVCLVPARTDTRWWHDYAARGEVRFLPGRVRFGGGQNSAPFPSAVVVFRNVGALRNSDVERYQHERPRE